MKITGLKTFVANVSRTNFVFVKLYTDEGIDGVGEATLEWKTLAVVAALEELERQLVGRDPFRSDALIEQLHRDSYWRTGAVFRTALGAVEAAMLDIKGKALGVPVFELLGGKYRDRVACYANHWFFGARTPEDYHAAATRGVAMGYRALKWDPFEASDLEMDRPQRNRTSRDRGGGPRCGGTRHRTDARRPWSPQRPDRHRDVQGARALRPDLDRGADAARVDRCARRGAGELTRAYCLGRALVRADPFPGSSIQEGGRHPAA